MKKNSPAIIRHEEVEVFGALILVAVDKDEERYFSPLHVCRAIGLAWSSQRLKISTNKQLSKGMITINMPSHGGPQNTLMLPLGRLSGWLFTINPGRVRDNVVPALERYQEEAYAVLDAWFRKNARAAEDPSDMQRLILQTIKEQEQRAEERLQKALAPVMVQVEALGIENKTMRPKVEAYDNVTEEGSKFLLSYVARELRIPRGVLTEILVEGGVLEASVTACGRPRTLPTDYAKGAGLTTEYHNHNGYVLQDQYYFTSKGRSLCERLAFDWKTQQEAA